MMLELKDVFYDDYDNLTEEIKAKEISKFEVNEELNIFIEFLYLNGDDKSWNWGKNGMTNAVFIKSEAREYFKKFF